VSIRGGQEDSEWDTSAASQTRYAAGDIGVSAAVGRGITVLPGHEFWPDDLTLFDSRRIHRARLLDSAQVTDSYLLVLAATHGGQLTTFDRHLVTDAVVKGPQSLHLIA